jgi:hypothetical protein
MAGRRRGHSPNGSEVHDSQYEAASSINSTVAPADPIFKECPPDRSDQFVPEDTEPDVEVRHADHRDSVSPVALGARRVTRSTAA